jgi:hypothetical protein
MDIALRNVLPAALFITGLFMILFVGILLFWHVALIAMNQTTWESASSSRITYLQQIHESAPFNGGILYNLRCVFCVPQQPIVWRFVRSRQLPPLEQTAAHLSSVV